MELILGIMGIGGHLSPADWYDIDVLVLGSIIVGLTGYLLWGRG